MRDTDGYLVHGQERMFGIRSGLRPCDLRAGDVDAVSLASRGDRTIVRKFPGAVVLAVDRDRCRMKVIGTYRPKDAMVTLLGSTGTRIVAVEHNETGDRLRLLDWSGRPSGDAVPLPAGNWGWMARVGDATVVFDVNRPDAYYVRGEKVTRLEKPVRSYVADAADPETLVFASASAAGRISLATSC